jgi:hypothetical protein
LSPPCSSGSHPTGPEPVWICNQNSPSSTPCSSSLNHPPTFRILDRLPLANYLCQQTFTYSLSNTHIFLFPSPLRLPTSLLPQLRISTPLYP